MDINILRNNLSLSPSFHISLSSLCLPSSLLFPPFSTHLFPSFSFFTAIEPWQQQLESNINTPEADLSKRHQVYRHQSFDKNWCRLPDSDCKAPHWIRNRDLSCPAGPWSDAQKPGFCCGSLQVPATAPCPVADLLSKKRQRKGLPRSQFFWPFFGFLTTSSSCWKLSLLSKNCG